MIWFSILKIILILNRFKRWKKNKTYKMLCGSAFCENDPCHVICSVAI